MPKFSHDKIAAKWGNLVMGDGVVGETKSLFRDFRKVMCCMRSRASFVSMYTYIYNRFYRTAWERYNAAKASHSCLSIVALIFSSTNCCELSCTSAFFIAARFSSHNFIVATKKRTKIKEKFLCDWLILCQIIINRKALVIYQSFVYIWAFDLTSNSHPSNIKQDIW